jgi:DNA/RNA endonuclease G (NUC1)
MLGEFEEINNSTAELMQNLSGIRAMMGYVGRELTNLRRLTDLRDQISSLQQQKPRLSQPDIDKQQVLQYSPSLHKEQVCSICLNELKDTPTLSALNLPKEQRVSLC